MVSDGGEYKLQKTLSQDDSVRATAISNDGSMIAVQSNTYEFKIYDTSDYSVILTIDDDEEIAALNSLEFSEDDNYIFGGIDVGIAALKVSDGTRVFDGLEGIVVNAVSTSSDYVAAGADDNNIYLFDISSDDPNDWTEITDSPLTEHSINIQDVEFSNDGSMLASASHIDGVGHIYIHNSSDWSVDYSEANPSDDVAFSDDDSYLAVGNFGVYDTSDWSSVYTFSSSTYYVVAWDSNSLFGVPASDGSYNIGRLDTSSSDESDWSIIQTLEGPTDLSRTLSADNDLMVAGSDDNNAYVYELTEWYFPRYTSDIMQNLHDELSKMDYDVFVGDVTIEFLDYPCISILTGDPVHQGGTAYDIPITINFYTRRDLESDTEMIDHEEEWEEISWRALEGIKSIWNIVHYRLDRNEQIQAAESEDTMVVLYQMTITAKRNVGLHPMYG